MFEIAFEMLYFYDESMKTAKLSPDTKERESDNEDMQHYIPANGSEMLSICGAVSLSSFAMH
jgi:hypothetical protein